MDPPKSGFTIFWTLFRSGYSVCIYQRVDLLYFGYCLYLGIVYESTKVDLLYFGNCPYLGANSECLYTDILCHFCVIGH